MIELKLQNYEGQQEEDLLVIAQGQLTVDGSRTDSNVLLGVAIEGNVDTWQLVPDEARLLARVLTHYADAQESRFRV